MSVEVDGIIGKSASIAALRSYLPKVARSPATVLITGETGTGKERVAEAVHRLSPRAQGPFVDVNCAALPESLVESELFGHERGAFTGASSARRGRFVEADKGTLFLDEIGEMPAHVQAKLLRALESGRVQPVGGGRAVPVDLRVVAATNQPLEALVRDHRFRADLFYRLNVARIDLPPLRDRAEDVPMLLAAAIAELNARDGRRVGAVACEVLDCLMAYEWPGNVRELRNLAEALFIDPPEGHVRFCDLPPAFRALFEPYRRYGSAERDRLVEVLRSTRWNKTEAARALNWSRMTLYRKLAHYQIETTSDG